MNEKKPLTLQVNRVRTLPQTPAISLAFSPGIHALVSARSELAQALLECMAGLRTPLGSPWNTGNVSLGNENPLSSPSLRAALGVTLPEEPALPAASSLRNSLEQLLALRSQHDSLTTVSPSTIPLVKELLNRAPESLTNTERRRVTLGLALSLRSPQALLLHHPLSHLALEETSFVLARLRSLVDEGKIIVCVTPTLEDAKRLSPHIQELGAFTQQPETARNCRIYCSEAQNIADLIRALPDSHEWFESVNLPESDPSCLVVTLASPGPAERAKLASILAQAPGTIYQVEHLP
jgi:ABC-type lipoprotein export system ATPase subunit